MSPRPSIALGLLAAYIAVTLVGRTIQHHRATGTRAFHGISGPAGSIEWWGGVLFVVALALGLVAPIAAWSGWARPWDRPAVLGVLGLVAFAAGFAATVWAQQAMGASWRIGVKEGERTRLVSSGPFGLTRNPIFSFMILAAAGLALYFPSPLTVASAVLLVIAIQLQVRFVEEPHLRRVHGDDYRAYCRAVGRFVPGIGRLG